MNINLSKILSIVTGVIGIIAIYFLTRIIMEGDETVSANLDIQNSIVSPFIGFAQIILIITAILAVGFSLWNLARHPKMLKKTLLSIAALGALLVIAYVMASDAAVYDVSGNVLEGGEQGSTSKWVSTGIWYTVILGAVGLGFFLWDFVKSLASK